MNDMRGIELSRIGQVGFVPPLQGGEIYFGYLTRGFTPGCHITGLQPDRERDYGLTNAGAAEHHRLTVLFFEK